MTRYHVGRLMLLGLLGLDGYSNENILSIVYGTI